MQVISTNEKRNMQQVVQDGQTRHIPINAAKPCYPKKKGSKTTEANS